MGYEMISMDQASSTASARCDAPVAIEYVWPTPARRLSGTFFKLLYRWTHSAAYRHNERLWRDVAVTRDASGCLTGISIGGREIHVENASHLNVARPCACHLIATGPSINDIGYDSLDLRYVMGVNGAIALQERHDLLFEFYCIVDAGFVRKRPDLVARVIQEDLTLFTTPLVLWYIAQCLPLERIRCRIFLIEDMLHPVFKRSLRASDLFDVQSDSDAVLFDDATPLGFSMNLRRGVIDGRTVAYSALQALVWLGFDTVFLHGLDLRDAAHTPRFYETADNMQPSSLDTQFDSFIEPSFRSASMLLGGLGVNVKNLSPNSALDTGVFEKVDWRTLPRMRKAVAGLRSAA
jgi:Kdo-III transferase WaaZ